MSYWACARVEPRRESVAQHFLKLAGYEVYLPRLRERRVSHGRRIIVTPPLFPSYIFVEIRDGSWWSARWCVGVVAVIMSGDRPARVPDCTLDEIRRREVRGAVELSKPPGLQRGDKVRIVRGAFYGYLGLYEGMRPHERVDVLLGVLGGQHRVVLPAADVEAARG
jgi:transcriptional antiterminator RfaH